MSQTEPHLCWMGRDGIVLASVEVLERRMDKTRGLLGRNGLQGAVLLPGTKSVHSLGMKFDLDVAFLDDENVVIKIAHLSRHRVTPLVLHSHSVLEAEAGAFEEWNLNVGDLLEFSDCE